MKMRELEKQTELERTAIEYMDEVYESIQERNPFEVEFLQAVKEIFDSLLPVFIKKSTIHGKWNIGENCGTRKIIDLSCALGGRYW